MRPKKMRVFLSNVSIKCKQNKKINKQSYWLYQISHGIDKEPVMSRQAAKSIGCSKNFRGKQMLNTSDKVQTS